MARSSSSKRAKNIEYPDSSETQQLKLARTKTNLDSVDPSNVVTTESLSTSNSNKKKKRPKNDDAEDGNDASADTLLKTESTISRDNNRASRGSAIPLASLPIRSSPRTRKPRDYLGAFVCHDNNSISANDNKNESLAVNLLKQQSHAVPNQQTDNEESFKSTSTTDNDKKDSEENRLQNKKFPPKEGRSSMLNQEKQSHDTVAELAPAKKSRKRTRTDVSRRDDGGSVDTPDDSNSKNGKQISSKNRGKSDRSAEKSSKGASSQKEVAVDREFATRWICCECREAECMMQPDADSLVICEGVCRRLFHYPCAGLAELPKGEFICGDCRANRFACAICQMYGIGQVDVYRCNVPRCGLFFHEACMVLREINFTLVVDDESGDKDDWHNTDHKKKKNVHRVKENDDEALPVDGGKDTGVCVVEPRVVEPCVVEPHYRPDFKCPAHFCWTCSWDSSKQARQHEMEYDGIAEDLASSNANKRSNVKKKRPTNPNRRSAASSSEKRSGELMRCLECPIAYHVSCIPPSARFHELALLCHEHAVTHKLPELDAEFSIQGSIEAKIDMKFRSKIAPKTRLRSVRRSGNGKTLFNKFFAGLSGQTLTKRESKLLQALMASEQENVSDDNRDSKELQEEELVPTEKFLPFCLPCDIKDEVYSKPPPYKHVHSLQYSPTHRPPRVQMSGEVCICVNACGEDCLNRILYLECVGELGSNNSNCAIGRDCGNRRLAKRQFVKCKPLREQGRGWGLVTCESVKAGDLVTEYVGEVIDARAKEERLTQWTRDHPNDPNFYVMSLSQQWYIDARKVANLSRFINHSCQPNCSLTRVNVDGYMRNGIYAIVDIAPGQFLSYDYRFDSRLDKDNKFVCRCGAPNCRGTMKPKESSNGAVVGSLSTIQGQGEAMHQGTMATITSASAAQNISWEQARKMLAKEQLFLEEVASRRMERLSQVDSMVPSASNADECVSNGVQERYQEQYTPHLFLWRNAKIGSDFERRLSKLRNNVSKNESKH